MSRPKGANRPWGQWSMGKGANVPGANGLMGQSSNYLSDDRDKIYVVSVGISHAMLMDVDMPHGRVDWPVSTHCQFPRT